MSDVAQDSDTIAAIATPPGEGSVSIVRVSGPKAFDIADRLFEARPPPPSGRCSGTFAHGRIRSRGADLDEVLMLFMRGPRSYTGEDVIEIQGHGGTQCARRILRAALEAGARPAEPGEFTRRAFLNGRMDLMQAEAVLDLIRARSERAAAAALEQLEGSLSKSFNTVYDDIVSATAQLEATLDFPEDELPPPLLGEIHSRLSDILRRLHQLISTWEEGHLLREGAIAVISGRPNVGKSTLLNALLGKDRAIVSSTPGTTRDTIEESLLLEGIPVRLIDTAGLRETDCEIEREGIRRTRKYMIKADLHIHMVDSHEPIAEPEAAQIRALDLERSILVLNKVDLGRIADIDALPPFKLVETCLLVGQGVPELRRAMLEKLSSHANLLARPHAAVSERHRALLDAAREQTQKALDLLLNEGEAGFVAACAHLRESLESLGLATGRVYHEELLDSIFSQFCIGK